MGFSYIPKKEALLIVSSLLDEQNFTLVFDAAREMGVKVSVYDALAKDVIDRFWYTAYEQRVAFRNISRHVSDDVHQQIQKLLISHGAAHSVLLMCSDRKSVLDPSDLLSLVCAAVQQVRSEEFPALCTYINKNSGDQNLPIQTAHEYLQMIQRSRRGSDK